MKQLFRWLCLLLVLMLLAGCNQPSTTPDVESTEATTDATTEETPSVPATISLWDKNGNAYTIIYSNDHAVYHEAGTNLNLHFTTKKNVSLPIYSDARSETAYEILIGTTNRAESDCTEELKENEYGVFVKGTKIVLQATTPALIHRALEDLMNELTFEKNMISLSTSTHTVGQGTLLTTLKVASYNLKNGDLAGHDFRLIAQDILDAGVDIVGLQEVDQNTTRNGKQDTLKLLAQYTGMQHYLFLPTISPYKGGEYGIAILSKYPIVSHSSIYLPKFIESDELRGALCAEIDVNGVKVNFVSTHCHWDGFDKQFAAIANMVEDKPNYVVVGDLNNSNFSLQASIFPKAHFAVYAAKPTVTTPNGSSIDNILVASNLYLHSFKVFTPGHSDHYMIYATVSVLNETK